MNNSKEFHSSGDQELNSQTFSQFDISASGGEHTKIDQEPLQGNTLLKQTQMKHSASLAEQSKINFEISRLGLNNTQLAKSKQETNQTSKIEQSILSNHQSYSSPPLGIGNSQNSQNPIDQSSFNQKMSLEIIELNEKLNYDFGPQPSQILPKEEIEPHNFSKELTFGQEQERIKKMNLLLEAIQLCLDTPQSQSDQDSKNQISHDKSKHDIQSDEQIGQNKLIQINAISSPSTKKRSQTTFDQSKIKQRKAIEDLGKSFKNSKQIEEFLYKLKNLIELLSNIKQLVAQFDQKKIMQLVFTSFADVKQEQMLKSNFQLFKEEFVRFLDLFSQIKQCKPYLKNESHAFAKVVAGEDIITKYIEDIEERKLLPSFKQWLKHTYSKIKESLEAKHMRKFDQKQQKDLKNYFTYLYYNNLNDPDNKSSTYISQIQMQADYYERLYEFYKIQRCIQSLQQFKPERLKLLETITDPDDEQITETSFQQKNKGMKREMQRKYIQIKQKQKREEQQSKIYSIYKPLTQKDAVYSLLDTTNDQSNIFPDLYFTLNFNDFRFNYRGFQKALRQFQSQCFDGLIEVDQTKMKQDNQIISIVNNNFHKLKDLIILKLILDTKQKIEEAVTMIRRIEPQNKSQELYDQKQQEQKQVNKLKIIDITLILKKQLVQPVSQLVKEITEAIERKDLLKVKPIKFIIISLPINIISRNHSILKLNLNQINLRFLFHESLQYSLFYKFDFSFCKLDQQKWEQFCQLFINFKKNVIEIDFSGNQISSITAAHLESIKNQFPTEKPAFLSLKNNPLTTQSYLSIAEFQMRNLYSKMEIFTSLTPEVHTMYQLIAALKMQLSKKVIYGLEWQIIRFLRSMIKNKLNSFKGPQTSPQIKKTTVINFLSQLKWLIPVSDNDKSIQLKVNRSWLFKNYGISGKEKHLIEKVEKILDCIRLYVLFWLELSLNYRAQFQEIVTQLKRMKDPNCENKRNDRKQLIKRKQPIAKICNLISQGKQSIAYALIQIYQSSFANKQEIIKYLSDFMLLQSFFSSLEQNLNVQDLDQYQYPQETEQKLFLLLLIIRFDQSFAGLLDLQESEDKLFTQIYLSEKIHPKLRGYFYLQLEQLSDKFIRDQMILFYQMVLYQNTKESHIQNQVNVINQLISFYLSRLNKKYAKRIEFLHKLLEGISEKQLIKSLNKENKISILQHLRSQKQKKNWLIMQFYRTVNLVRYSYLDDINFIRNKYEKFDYQQIDAERNFAIDVRNWSFYDGYRSRIQRKKFFLNFMQRNVKADFQALIGLVKLNLSSCELNARQFSLIVANLHKLKDLIVLNLRDSNITTVTEDHIQKLVQLKIRHQTQLKFIDLRFNKLTNQSKFLIDKFNSNNRFMTHKNDCSKQTDMAENSEQKSKDSNQNNESTDEKANNTLQKVSRNRYIFIDNRYYKSDWEEPDMSQSNSSQQHSSTSSQIYDPNYYSDLQEDSKS